MVHEERGTPGSALGMSPRASTWKRFLSSLQFFLVETGKDLEEISDDCKRRMLQGRHSGHGVLAV